MRALVLRHDEGDLPGLVGDAFAARGATVDTYLYSAGVPLPDLGGYDHLVVLGSSASAYEEKAWIVAEIEWLRHAPLPVLGICFGAHLLSMAFGGAVERAPAYEMGWVRVDPVDPVDAVDPTGPAVPVGPAVCDDAPPPVIGRGPWFEHHGDRCVLPETARVLARNEVCVQAFTIGPHLGVQFHPEVDTAQVRRWLERGGREKAIRAGKDPDSLLEETAREEPHARGRADELVRAHLAHAAA